MGLRNPDKCARSDSYCLAVTEHPLPDGRKILVLINYRPTAESATVKLDGGYTLLRTVKDAEGARITSVSDGFEIELQGNDGVVVLIGKV